MGGLVVLIIIAVIVGVVVLKGFALWRAARNGDRGWFIAMLVINLMGILEAIYLITHPDKTAPASPTASSSPVPKQ